MCSNQTAFLISSLALFFTIFSFWWMNWRRGKLEISNIRTYVAASKDGKIIIELPIILFNSGARPILVENLRLNLYGHDNDRYCLDFIATVNKLGTDENRAFATPFAVHGGKAIELICEFQCKSQKFGFYEGSFELELEGLLGHKVGWRRLRKFILNISELEAITMNTMIKAYDNKSV